MSLLEVTCSACPTQIEGYIPGWGHIYFRYRHGWASVDFCATGDALGSDGIQIYGQDLGGSLDGYMEPHEAEKIIKQALMDHLLKQVEVEANGN